VSQLTVLFYLQGRGGIRSINNTMEESDQRMPSVGGVLMDFVKNAQRLPHFSVFTASLAYY
jgi:hypothetical protein